MARKVTNEQHYDAVVRRVYRDALNVDWEYQTHREHTEQYARWLADPEVGGVLSEWMSPEDVRVWLKDGPLKEFARALAGEGPFAGFLDAHPRAPSVVVARALGPGWSAIAGTNDVKPLRCGATDGTSRVTLMWGPSKDFKHLLWAALEAADANPKGALKVAVFDTVSAPFDTSERARLGRIAARCAIDVAFIRL